MVDSHITRKIREMRRGDELKEIEMEENFMKLDFKKTDLMKASFIEEINNGLGDEIRKVGNTIEVKPKKKPSMLKRFFKTIFRI